MFIIVLDLEASIQRYKGMDREILEIGAIKLDENLKVVSKFQSYVRPIKRYNMKDLVIGEKTIIPKEKIINERDINRVMYLFSKWARYGGDYVVATWSDSDIDILFDNYYVTKFTLSWMKHHIDIQDCFGKFVNSDRRISLVDAYKIVNKESISLYNHNALNDAYNSAVILKYLMNNNYRITYEKYPFKNIVCKLKRKCDTCGKKRPMTSFTIKTFTCDKCLETNN